MEASTMPCYSATNEFPHVYASMLSNRRQHNTVTPNNTQYRPHIAPAPTPSHSAPVMSSSRFERIPSYGTLLYDGHPMAFQSPFFAQPLPPYLTSMVIMPMSCWPIANKNFQVAASGKPHTLFHDQSAWKEAIMAEYARMTLQQSQLLDEAAQRKHRNSSAVTTSTTTTPAGRNAKDKDAATQPATALTHDNIPSPSVSTSSSVDSTPISSRSASPVRRGHHDEPKPSPSTSSSSVVPATGSTSALHRELRRLRTENANLSAQLRITRADLKAERETRLLDHKCHEKYMEEIDKQNELLQEKDDEIRRLKELLVEAQRAASDIPVTSAATKRRNGFWGDHDVVSAESASASEEESGDTGVDDSKEGEANRFERGGVEVITHRAPIGYASGEDDADGEDEEEEEGEKSFTVDFAALATSHLKQALVSGLNSASTNLCLDDLVMKYEPSTDDVVRVLAEAFVDWAVDKVSSLSSTSTPIAKQPHRMDPATAALQESVARYWRVVMQNFVHSEDDMQCLLTGLEARVGALVREGKPGVDEFARQYQRVLVLLYKYDVIEGDAVVEWWHRKPPPHPLAPIEEGRGGFSGACHWRRTVEQQAPRQAAPAQQQHGADLRHVSRRFVEWVQRDSNTSDEDEEASEEGGDEEEEDDEQEVEEGSDIAECVDSEEDDVEDKKVDGSDARDEGDEGVCPCRFEEEDECVCTTGEEEGAEEAVRREKKSVRFAM
ncbi:hypothetical protein BC938DRAFT_483977 [Jimgerdemannia flammicorona]|uniref:W2 domain-containing protein n=1 Tax=Jimgerdemannia flammicorona TaxID=994334 RepID=A0A433QAU9_9FUNG|nr:hypothetical protein BC938DRAFT_483977 [Jimgerdemannia flammicorona]